MAQDERDLPTPSRKKGEWTAAGQSLLLLCLVLLGITTWAVLDQYAPRWLPEAIRTNAAQPTESQSKKIVVSQPPAPSVVVSPPAPSVVVSPAKPAHVCEAPKGYFQATYELRPGVSKLGMVSFVCYGGGALPKFPLVIAGFGPDIGFLDLEAANRFVSHARVAVKLQRQQAMSLLTMDTDRFGVLSSPFTSSDGNAAVTAWRALSVETRAAVVALRQAGVTTPPKVIAVYAGVATGELKPPK